jgi:hypothetical protein
MSARPGAARVGREVHLVRRPRGLPEPGDFELAEVEAPRPAEGEILVEAAYVSLDPYLRIGMGEVEGMQQPLGEPPPAFMVGRVAESRAEGLDEGDVVVGRLGWREWAVAAADVVSRFDAQVPLSTSIGVLGMPGFTAWCGARKFSDLKAGETVYVSAAAGAVGSLIGQMWARRGCRVIGSAGSEEKLAWLREIGFDAVFNYRDRSVADALSDLAPEGLHLYFDNVGGSHLEAALASMRAFGLVLSCGSIGSYNEEQPGPRNLDLLYLRSLTLLGFSNRHYHDTEFGTFIAEAAPLVADGHYAYRESVGVGIESIPERFRSLFSSETFGKSVVAVGATASAAVAR